MRIDSVCGTTTSVAIVVVLLAGCLSLSPSELVDVTLSVSDTVVSEALPVVIDVAATNRGDSDVTVSGYGCPQLYRVIDGNGSIVGPEGAYCLAMVVPPATLSPGESIEFQYTWSGRGNSEFSAPLPTGEYELQAWILVLPQDSVFSGTAPVRVVGSPTAVH